MSTLQIGSLGMKLWDKGAPGFVKYLVFVDKGEQRQLPGTRLINRLARTYLHDDARHSETSASYTLAITLPTGVSKEAKAAFLGALSVHVK